MNNTLPIKSVCVYCGSRTGERPAYAALANRIGELIAANGLSLVYGAGSIGLMGIVARAARDAGAPVIGVIPEHLDDVEITQEGLAELHVTENMHDRKRMMFERSDAFLIMPGGLGTLDETFEIVTWAQLGLHRKPIILLNQDGFWTPLLTLVDHIVREGFVSAANAELLHVANSADEAFDLLHKLHAADSPAKSDLF